MRKQLLVAFIALMTVIDGLPVDDSDNSHAASPSISDRAEPVSVWMGQLLTLSCEDDKELGDDDDKRIKAVKIKPTWPSAVSSNTSFHRLWRKGSDLLTASTVVISLDERVKVVNEHVFTLANVTAEDEGDYVCEVVAKPKSVYKKFVVSVVEVICGEPDQIPHGYMDPATGTVDTYRYGDTVVYSCNEGYTLVGERTRTCLQPGTGWEGDVPRCELEEIAHVSTRINTLENKLNRIFNTDMEILLKVEEKFTDLEGRVKSLEGDTDLVRNNRGKNSLMEREVHHLKKALTLNAVREPWQGFLNSDVARLGVRDGHIVSEYTWVVKDFESKMIAYKDLNFDYITSPAFYTHVPGYHMQLHLYPNYDQSDHVGIYAILLSGRFDDVIAWPFTSKYVMSIGTFNAEASDVFDTIVPVRATTCRFERPLPNNDIGCGLSRFLDHATLREKGHLHKQDGGLLFRISIFLDD